MDEQTTPQQGTTSEATYDAPDTYAPPAEPEENLPPEQAAPEPPIEDYNEPQPEGQELSPEVTLNEDGEVNFSDDFFGDLPKEQTQEQSQGQAQGQAQAQPEANPQTQQLNYYTDDELRQIPFEQWDVNRLNGDIHRYVPIYREQIARRQASANVMQRPNNPSFMMTEPKQYTPKELSDAAQKLACEKLGLSNADDFDEYEGEHRAALNLAMQELAYKRQGEIAEYQRAANEYQKLQRYNAELANRPDFVEFDRWFSGKLVAKGLTPQQVNEGLLRYASENNGDFGTVQGVISNWYREFQAERAASQNTQNRQPQPQRQRAARPPVLEGSGNSGYDTRKKINLDAFGDMDMDGQAQALMSMGIV